MRKGFVVVAVVVALGCSRPLPAVARSWDVQIRYWPSSVTGDYAGTVVSYNTYFWGVSLRESPGTAAWAVSINFDRGEMTYPGLGSGQFMQAWNFNLHRNFRLPSIGKVAVRDAVLLKAGPLSPHERLEAQGHVEAGGRILRHLSVYARQLPVLLQHHERVDGHGYPAGLQGESIDLGARILSACDVFDSLTSDRPYRRAMSSEAAMAELYHHAGSQFDPRVVAALERVLLQEHRLKAAWRATLIATPSDGFSLTAGGPSSSA